MRTLICGLALGIPAAVASAACPDASDESMSNTLTRLDDAYYSIDEATFDAVADEIRDLIPCTFRRLSVAEAAEIHRVSALVAFVDGDSERSVRSWAAGRALQPHWRLSFVDFPDGHPFRKAFESANPDADSAPLPDPGDFSWLVDGSYSDNAPANRAFLLQAEDTDGAIALTSYIFNGEEVAAVAASLATRVRRGARPEVIPLVRLRGGPLGAYQSASQQVETPKDAWKNRTGSIGGVGASLSSDLVLSRLVAFDFRARLNARADPVRGGDYEQQWSAAAAIGPAVDTEQGATAIRARLGAAVDTMRAWTGDGPRPDSERFAVPSASVGLGAAIHREALHGTLTGDYLLASGYRPFGWRARLLAERAVNPTVLVFVDLTASETKIDLTTDEPVDVGRVRNIDLAAAAGVSLRSGKR